MKRYRDWIVIQLATVTLASCGGGGGDGGVGGPGGPGPSKYSIGGTVTGLSGSGLVLQATGAGTATVSASGAFTFPTSLADGTAYTIGVRAQPTNQLCSVSNALEIDPSGRFAYGQAINSRSLYALAIDPATGALTPVPGSPITAGMAPGHIVFLN